MTLGVKPRTTMYSRVFMGLIGAVHIYFQVLASVEDVYIAELTVESNVTLEANTILSVFNSTNDLQKVILSNSELVAECLIIGEESNCSCSINYIWSNTVCDNYNCCRETHCEGNVFYIEPFCIAKVKVRINGSIIMNTGTWDSAKTTMLKTNFEDLNGFEFLNVIGQRLADKVVEFEAAASVLFPTSKLQTIINNLETIFGAVLMVDTRGMVTIEAPETSVCYNTEAVMKCAFEEATGHAGWNLSRKYERFELNNGSVVKLDYNCTTEEYLSCVRVKLQNVTGIWSGLYECGFTSGSVRHTAKIQLNVSLLPDTITLKIDPLSVNCFGKTSTESVPVKVTATILNVTESFEVWWSYMGKRKSDLSSISDGDYLVYSFTADINCKHIDVAQIISVSFKNIKGQIKSEELEIPVIYDGDIFCKEEYDTNGEFWPSVPDGNTLINNTCAAGRVGFKSRTCEGTIWQPVFYNCINVELYKISNQANNFLKGLGATQEIARNIFSGLKNVSIYESDPSESTANIMASINVLGLMDRASKYIALQDDILPDLVDAGSNMLTKSWDRVNQSYIHQMSSKFLQSVQGLVESIRVNKNDLNIFNSKNIELKFCRIGECNVSVFGIDVVLNKTKGILKIFAVDNLMDKLKNSFRKTLSTRLILSATLQDNNDSSLKIRMQFSKEKMNHTKPYCVFWDPTKEEWSDVGCVVQPGNGNHTVCKCNHLTAFSVLMAKEDISNDILDTLTYVGLGVSICSLLIFLTVEFLVWSAVVKSNLSHFRHTAIVNIATFLLLADISFLISTKGIGGTWCLALTLCKHLFFLVMFSWMMCLSVMLVHQLIFVFSPLRKRVFMFLSCIVGYVFPLLIVGSSYTYCNYTDQKYFNETTCWLVYDKLLEGSLHAFLLPVGTVILTNLFSLVVVIVTVVKSSAPEGSKSDDKETAKGIIKVVVFLMPVFGLTWIIGFALLLLDTNNPMYTVASYSFTILNSFQGLFLLITGCFAEQKVREEILKLIIAKSKGKSESMKNLTSTAYTKDK